VAGAVASVCQGGAFVPIDAGSGGGSTDAMCSLTSNACTLCDVGNAPNCRQVILACGASQCGNAYQTFVTCTCFSSAPKSQCQAQFLATGGSQAQAMVNCYQTVCPGACL
jgi:hypothetical protein